MREKPCEGAAVSANAPALSVNDAVNVTKFSEWHPISSIQGSFEQVKAFSSLYTALSCPLFLFLFLFHIYMVKSKSGTLSRWRSVVNKILATGLNSKSTYFI